MSRGIKRIEDKRERSEIDEVGEEMCTRMFCHFLVKIYKNPTLLVKSIQIDFIVLSSNSKRYMKEL